MHIRRKPCDNDRQNLHCQLINDFGVYNYLQQHQLDSDNADSYAKLLNALITSHRTRTKHLLGLKSVKSLVQQHREFDAIQEKICIEGEICQNLERQITETKKSLNLLRGDIGFLVSRNESAQLLNSKISKVKIVAQDQLKRVSFAFSKDKQQLKIRNEMQKKFGKKLKNIQGYESASLSRLKQYYMKSQVRKNEICGKLYASQTAAQSGQEMSLIQRQKETIDRINSARELTLIALGRVISRFSLDNLHSSEQGSAERGSSSNMVMEIERYLSQLLLPERPEEGEVQAAIAAILAEYHSLKDSIKDLRNFYNEQLKAKQQLSIKLQQLLQKQQDLFHKFELQSFNNYILTPQRLRDQRCKLSHFEGTLRSYFKLLAYLERYGNERQNGKETDKLRDSSFCSDGDVKCDGNAKYLDYITRLHAIQRLLRNDSLCELPNCSEYHSPQKISKFYESLAREVQERLSLLKLKISQGEYYPVERCSYQKTTICSEILQFLIPLQDLGQFCNQVSPKQDPQPQSLVEKSEGTAAKAQRIRLLQDVDRDYYKMIKATMKMQKQNIRKNYQFQRVFKRAKYASRDDILEEKRFEASFSVLSTKKSSPALTRLGLQSRNSRNIRNSRNSTVKGFANTVHGQSSFKPRKDLVQFQKDRVMQWSMNEEGKQRTRLNEKLKEALGYSSV